MGCYSETAFRPTCILDGEEMLQVSANNQRDALQRTHKRLGARVDDSHEQRRNGQPDLGVAIEKSRTTVVKQLGNDMAGWTYR